MSDRQQSGISFYEYKLERVMKRLRVDSYRFNWDRWGCYVDFYYQGELYRFEHSVEKAGSRGVELRNGSEAFIGVVITFEEIANIVERGIYGLETWVRGMRYIPVAVETPEYFKILGFTEVPAGIEDVRQRYQTLVSRLSSEEGENGERVKQVKDAAEEALSYFENAGKRNRVHDRSPDIK